MKEHAATLEGGEERDPRAEALVQIIREETGTLERLLEDARIRQWEPARAIKPREDTTERGTGDRSDPTGDTALDGRRLAVRRAVLDAERLLRETAIRTRGVRIFLEKAVASWDGEDTRGE